MFSNRDDDGVYESTKRTIEQSEARVAVLRREIALLEEIIEQNRGFLERIESGSFSRRKSGNASLSERIGGSVKTLPGKAAKVSRKPPRSGDKRLRGGTTYAAAILAVLERHPKGLTTAELTEHFRAHNHPIAERDDAAKAVSNQLSQLKAKNLVARDRSKRFTLANEAS